VKSKSSRGGLDSSSSDEDEEEFKDFDNKTKGGAKRHMRTKKTPAKGKTRAGRGWTKDEDARIVRLFETFEGIDNIFDQVRLSIIQHQVVACMPTAFT